MRRIVFLLVLTLVAPGLVTGCGNSGTSTPGGVVVTGAYGKLPMVKIPAGPPANKLEVKVLKQGSGPAVPAGASFVARSAYWYWTSKAHQMVSSTFGQPPGVLSGNLVPGLRTGLAGQRIGSRVLVVIPPKDGPHSNSPGTAATFIFVVDMVATLPTAASGSHLSNGGGGLPTVTDPAPGTAPAVSMPSGKPPASLVAKTLIKGTGPAVTSGEEVYVQYVGALWRNGKVFDASWSRHQPLNFTIGAPNSVIEGWTKGLTGQTVGSRVLLVIPPADGYGSAGQPQAGIKGTDTLVFVVDVLAALPASQLS
jgi:peptidylprolyl isomerase